MASSSVQFYYRFDGDVLDSSLYERDGSLYVPLGTGTSTYTDGVYGDALSVSQSR